MGVVMQKLLKTARVNWIEPTAAFEQLEERIVLDAALAPVANQAAVEHQAFQVDVNTANPADEHAATFVYDDNPTDGIQKGLEISADGGATFKPWQEFNAEPGRAPANQINIQYQNTDPHPGLITWMPGDLDGGKTYIFRVNSYDSAGPTSDQISFQVMVQNINDAPSLDNSGTPALTSQMEDDASSTGTLVSDLIAAMGSNVSDVDGDPLGIAIIGADNTNGTWEFWTPSITWQRFDYYVTESNALLLAPDARIRFVPNPNWSGDITDAITFRAWDQTQGTSGSTMSTTTHGGTSAFSDGVETASMHVQPVMTFLGAPPPPGPWSLPHAVEDQQFLFDVETDDEQTERGSVTYSFENVGPDFPLSIDGNTGVISWNPTNKDVTIPTGGPEGIPYQFTVKAVYAATGEVAYQAMTLHVENVVPTWLNHETDIYMTESAGPQVFNFQTDDENDPVNLVGYEFYAWDGNPGMPPSWLTLDDPVAGVLVGNPSNADATVDRSGNSLRPPYQLTMKFDDGNGGIAYKTFNIHVRPKLNEFTSGETTTWAEDDDPGNWTFDVNTLEEAEGDNVKYSLANLDPFLVGKITIDEDTGVISLVPGVRVDNLWVSSATGFPAPYPEPWGPNPATWKFDVVATEYVGPGGTPDPIVQHF